MPTLLSLADRPARSCASAVVVAASLLLLSGCSDSGGDHPKPSSADEAKAQGAPADASPQPSTPAKVTTGPELDFDLTPGNGKTVGVGQPVSLQFHKPVKNKAAVENALTVTTDNGTEGSWGWVKTPTGYDRLDWRPKDYWTPNTKVRVQGDLTVVDPGNGHFTRTLDRAFTIGRDQRMVADLDKHTLTVTRDGQAVKTIPMSGGEPVKDRASRPGIFVLKTKEEQVRMTSASVGGPKEYDTLVQWAMRFTDTGGYLHAAPWADDKGDLGKKNTSAGCIGMSDTNSKWLFENSQLGDLVTIQGQEATGPLGGPGNGYADWNLTWDQWQALSAAHS
ncbi:Ig-like domain-containing protein [Streptomyces sp. NPDC002886]|uniref:L,D-transpeptidase n=1 Tax=Streptomyces sp. NPDC002886 TaxID=3364667 RepID=UPI00369155C5